PRPVWDAEAIRHIIDGFVVAGHRGRGCPSEVVAQHLVQRSIVGESDICKSLVETGNRTAVHFVVLPVTTVHFDNGGLVAIAVGVRVGATECLGPVSGESLDVVWVEAMAKRVSDHFVDDRPTMPGLRKTAKPVHSTRSLEDSLHVSIMAIASS